MFLAGQSSSMASRALQKKATGAVSRLARGVSSEASPCAHRQRPSLFPRSGRCGQNVSWAGTISLVEWHGWTHGPVSAKGLCGDDDATGDATGPIVDVRRKDGGE